MKSGVPDTFADRFTTALIKVGEKRSLLLYEKEGSVLTKMQCAYEESNNFERENKRLLTQIDQMQEQNENMVKLNRTLMGNISTKPPSCENEPGDAT